MTKVIIDGKEYCAETLLSEVKRLKREVIASAEFRKMELEVIKAEIEDYKANYPVWDDALNKALSIINKHIGKENK